MKRKLSTDSGLEGVDLQQPSFPPRIEVGIVLDPPQGGVIQTIWERRERFARMVGEIFGMNPADVLGSYELTFE